MNHLLDLIYGQLGQRITWTLLHFVWQGLAIALLLVALVWILGARKAHTRYALSVLALLAMVACLPVTFALMDIPGPKPAPLNTETSSPHQMSGTANAGQQVEQPPAPFQRQYALPAEAEMSPPPTFSLGSLPADQNIPAPSSLPARFNLATILSALQPHMLMLWGIGVMLLSVRLLLGMASLHRVAAGKTPVTAEIAQRVSCLAKRLGMAVAPPAFGSLRVAEAVALGFLRPVVLIPAAWLTEMTPEMLEAVIAHELAHIRRWDLWVNLFQRFVETVLFYHPAVWWLSRRVRRQREMCCDELAVSATGQRLTYVDALQEVVRRRVRAFEPAAATVIAIGGTKMAILERVRYLLGAAPPQDNIRLWPVGILTMLVPLLFWLSPVPGVKPVAAEDAGKFTASASLKAPDVESAALIEPKPSRSQANTTDKMPSASEQGTARKTVEKNNLVSDIKFVGNQTASRARLAKVIEFQKGEWITQQKVDEDIEKLTAYYRGLGFFRVKIGLERENREAGAQAKDSPSQKKGDVVVNLLIDEGTRFKIRHVAVTGNKQLQEEELLKGLKLNEGQYFNQNRLTADLKSLKDKYVTAGYSLTDVRPDVRFPEQDGNLDLIYTIEEGLPSAIESPKKARPDRALQEGERVLAHVGAETIYAKDIMPEIDRYLADFKDKLSPEELELYRGNFEKQREILRKRNLKVAIESRLILLDVKREIPAEGLPAVIRSLTKHFDETQLPKLMEREKAATKEALEQKLKAYGSSLEQERNAYIERMLVSEWVRRQMKKDEMPTVEQMKDYYDTHRQEFRKANNELLAFLDVQEEIRTKLINERQNLRYQEYLNRLKSATKIWTIYDEEPTSSTKLKPAEPTVDIASAASPANVSGTTEPPSPDKQPPKEIWSLKLKDAVRCALQNSKVMRQIGATVTTELPKSSASNTVSALRNDKLIEALLDHGERLLLVRLNTDISLLDFEATVRNLVADVEATYWELYFAHHNLDAVRTGRDQALATWQKIDALRREGAKGGDAASEAQSREQYYRFRSATEQALSTLYEAESRLRHLMGLAVTDGRLILPSDEPTTAKVTFNWTEISAEALRRSIDIRRQKFQIKQREQELAASKEYAKSYVDSSDASLRNANLALSKEQAILREAELEVSHALATAFRDVEMKFATAQTRFNERTSAKAQLEAVKTAYETGRVNLDILLQAQRLRAQADADYYRAAVEYAKSIAAVHHRKGSLLDYAGICLAEELTKLEGPEQAVSPLNEVIAPASSFASYRAKEDAKNVGGKKADPEEPKASNPSHSAALSNTELAEMIRTYKSNDHDLNFAGTVVAAGKQSVVVKQAKAEGGLYGFVVLDDQPRIPDADVFLFRVTRSKGEVLLQKCRTDAQGRFAFEPVPKMLEDDEDFLRDVIVATAKDKATCEWPFDRGSKWFPLAGKMVLEMCEHGAIKGRVVNAQGKPIAGVKVHSSRTLTHPPEGILCSFTNAEGFYEIDDAIQHNTRYWYRTDDSWGVVRDIRLPQKERLYLIHPEYSKNIIEYEKVPCNLENAVLQPCGYIEGRVIDQSSGKPAEGVVVTAFCNRLQFTLGRAQTVTDAEGRYRFNSLNAGNYALWAERKDKTVKAIDGCQIVAGQNFKAPDLVLIEGRFIQGRLLDADSGEPFQFEAGKLCCVKSYGPARPKNTLFESNPIKADGTFQIRVAPGRNYLRLELVKNWYVETDSSFEGLFKIVDVAEGQTAKVEFKVTRLDAPKKEEKRVTGAKQVAAEDPLRMKDWAFKEQKGETMFRGEGTRIKFAQASKEP